MTYKEDYWDEYAHHDTSNEGVILSGCLQGVLSIILVVLIVLLCCMLSACKTTKYVPVVEHRTDTVRLSRNIRDSIYLHDSIYVSQQQRGDTIMLTTDRWHTQYRDRWRTDTIYRSRTDTVVKTIVKQQGKPAGTLTWWQQTRLYVANVLMGGMLIAIAVWLIRRRMRM